MCDTITSIVGLVGPPVISADVMPGAAQALSMLLIKSEARNLERQQMAEQEDWDDEAEEEVNVEEGRGEELVSRLELRLERSCACMETTGSWKRSKHRMN